ncbi:MAG TPA: farnesyl diphosphate synthase [Casimicrobiaceae bacterium]|jgi:farnesyl diphosphate synthase|nr:farnesyl diphosphate synthase [Casimicrobiaceae bacterium]
MNPDVAWPVWSRERAQRVESALEGALPPADESPQSLHAAMRYAALGGGKRVRALLAYASGELAGADAGLVDHAAVAVELIHAYSLVHDDLPCMDDDVLRRGKPTCHVAYGEAVALLAGDALQTLAFEVLAKAPLSQAQAQIAILAEAAGSHGMAGGQALDLAHVGDALSLNELERMHALKTGALIHAAVRLGAACGRTLDRAQDEALDRYAAAVGLGFQIVDDVLDVEGTAHSLGKTAGKDAAQGKATYVSLLGLDAAKVRVAELRDEAHTALLAFGAGARRLNELADWIALRKN